MFVLGHLGVGSALARPCSRGLKKRFMFLGTLLPDLIDKPLYYGLSLITGLKGADLGIISGTRTFGHTALFLLTLCVIAFARRSRVLVALALGIATHLVLDGLWDRLGPTTLPLGDISPLAGIFWPALGTQFPIYPFNDVQDHLSKFLQPAFWGGELLGLALLSLELLRFRYPSEYRTKPPR